MAHYEQLLERGETPDISKFGIGGSERLIECYIRYLDKSVKELVYMLTFFPAGDEKLVRKASTEILGSFSLADFKRVKKLSITTKLDETHYFIHRTVSEILRQDSDNDLQEYAANFLINYFSPVLDEASPYSEQYSNALANVMHGGLLLHENREDLVVFYRDHIKKRMNTLHSCHRDDQIKKIFTPFWEHASAKSDDSLYAFALSERAWRMFQSKDIRRDALDWTMQALQLNYKLLGENHLDTIDILHTLAGLLDLNYHHSDAIAAYQYVADKYKTYFPDRQSGLFNIKRNLALAYLSIRDYTHSDALFEELLEDYKTHFGREDRRTLRAMRDVAISYRRQGNYEQSRELLEQALDLSSKTFGEDHPDTIMSMVGLATTCQRQGDFQRELELLEKIIDMRCRLQGEGHPDTQRALENLAARYSALENFSKSISVWERLLKTRRISEGEDHFKTTNAIINIARNYIKLHDHAKIIALYMDTLEIWRTLWANDQQRILKSWDTIVRGISSSGEYELAAQLYELVLIGPQGALLAINPATSLLIHNLAECYYCFGNYEAAYSVLKDLLAWEADHTPFTSQTAAFLANVLCKLGRDDEATQVVEQYPDKLPFSRRSPFVPTSKPVPNWAPTLQPAPPSAPTPRPAPSPSLTPRPIPVRPSVSYSGLSLTEVMDEIGKTLERHKLRAAPPPKPVGSKGAPSTISLKELLELVQK